MFTGRHLFCGIMSDLFHMFQCETGSWLHRMYPKTTTKGSYWTEDGKP